MIVQASLLSNNLYSLFKSSKGSETKLKSNSKEWVHPGIIFSKVWLRTLMFLLCMSLKSHYIVHIHIVLNLFVFSFACSPNLDSIFFMFQASSHSCVSTVSVFFICVLLCMWTQHVSCAWIYMSIHIFLWCCFYRYASIKAIETKSRTDNQQWLTYWVLYSMLTLFELTFAKVLEL